VEKCVELGITRLIPLHTQRSVTHPHEAKMARFERAVVEACKQCGRDWLMAVDPLTPFEDLVADTSGDRWLMHPGGAAMSRSTWSMDPTIAIGPEGGFAPDEIERACGAGWQTFAFAGAILRVETAALFAASALARG
jgi:16S rRNA (uracil1498-N3)-methyltransferase